ncbi:MAG: class I SAM-dependent rRNA methyltransferase [Vicinamibacteria bacterium]|jgi:23S rRNA (cytosine1962-C5)-methyltransferase|nr:class I SAM-dependent rRNA methyltransferase [Vicinamibacteria bacterium]
MSHAQATPRVVINRKGEMRLRRGHPWIFRSDVVRREDVAPGDVVAVHGARSEVLGWALYSSRSEIQLRLLTTREEWPGDFLETRLTQALAWRAKVAEGASAYRIVHGEGDVLPGLVVDRYGEYLVVQTLCQAMERRKDEIVALLVERLHPRGILERNDPRVRLLEGLEQKVGLLHGEVAERVEVEEGGLRFAVDLWKGQKTGLFLDQRENHIATRSYARGRALDAFTYNGGFALQAARAAEQVLAIDVSKDALAQLADNAALNGLTNVVTREANAFDALHDLADRGERFDTIILDPPAFAKSRDAIPKAERGYKEINLRAMQMLAIGGCLITSSCSYHVNAEAFEMILTDAAVDAGAIMSVVERRRQARDHPIVLGVPETSYLKCFILRRIA